MRFSRARLLLIGSGLMILAAAGLLEDHKATSHWVTRDLPVQVGAEPSVRGGHN